VLDPFVGGGTTVTTAERLNRKWIGIDQSVMAIKVSEYRLNSDRNMFSHPFEVQLPIVSEESLKNMEWDIFEKMIVSKFGGIPNTKQRNDFGIDGHLPDGTPVQVKKWNASVGRNTLDNFLSAVQRSDKKLFEKNKKAGKPVGYVIGFEFNKGIIDEVARLKNSENLIVELKAVKEIIQYDKAPKVSLSAQEIDYNKFSFATEIKNDAETAFYAWDFSYNDEVFTADVAFDKSGKQTRKFPDGEHNIAVKAIDKQGLDGSDKVKIKVKTDGKR
jgi:hypothetical protein